MALSTNQFVHPSDKAALDKLEAIPGFPMLVKKVMNIGLETYMYGVNMASAIRLSEKQLPEIYRHLPPICAKLGIPEPELYLQMDPVPNAWTFGDTRIFITVTSGLVESMTDEELDAVLAHECGHILCRHVLYHTIAHLLNFGASLLGPVASLVTSAVQYALLYWSRMSELSADRVSALVTSPEIVASTMARLSGGPKSITANINFEEWGRQAYEYDRICNDGAWNNVLQKLAIMDSDHPFSAVRVREIMLWCQSEEFARARGHLDSLSGGAAPQLPGAPPQLPQAAPPQEEPPQPPAAPEQHNGRGGLLGNLGNMGNLGVQGGMAEAKKMANKLGGLGGRLLSRKQSDVSLSKGGEAVLTENRLLAGFGWSAPAGVDLDVSAFLLGANGKVESNQDFVFFNNMQHISGSVCHLGSALEGSTGDKAQLALDLHTVPANVCKIAVALTIYDGENRSQSFGQVQGAYVRLADRTAGTELVRYEIGSDFAAGTGVVVGELCRQDGVWKFKALGAGVADGLQGMVRNFGIGAK